MATINYCISLLPAKQNRFGNQKLEKYQYKARSIMHFMHIFITIENHLFK